MPQRIVPRSRPVRARCRFRSYLMRAADAHTTMTGERWQRKRLAFKTVCVCECGQAETSVWAWLWSAQAAGITHHFARKENRSDRCVCRKVRNEGPYTHTHICRGDRRKRKDARNDGQSLRSLFLGDRYPIRGWRAARSAVRVMFTIVFIFSLACLSTPRGPSTSSFVVIKMQRGTTITG